RLRALVSAWIAEPAVDGILVTGGTGFTGRDSTPEALLPLLDKEMPGFGELFRAISVEEIGTSSLQSRAFAGVANATFLFALPGRRGAFAGLANAAFLFAQADPASAGRTARGSVMAREAGARAGPGNAAGLRLRLREA